jgi:hypothetical protein
MFSLTPQVVVVAWEGLTAVCAFWIRDKFHFPAGSPTPDGPLHSPVTEPTELSQKKKNSEICENYLGEGTNKFLAILIQKVFGLGAIRFQIYQFYTKVL